MSDERLEAWIREYRREPSDEAAHRVAKALLRARGADVEEVPCPCEVGRKRDGWITTDVRAERWRSVALSSSAQEELRVTTERRFLDSRGEPLSVKPATAAHRGDRAAHARGLEECTTNDAAPPSNEERRGVRDPEPLDPSATGT